MCLCLCVCVMSVCMHETKCRFRLTGNLGIYAPFSNWARGGRILLCKDQDPKAVTNPKHIADTKTKQNKKQNNSNKNPKTIIFL